MKTGFRSEFMQNCIQGVTHSIDVRLQTARAFLAKALNGSVWEYTLCLCKFNPLIANLIHSLEMSGLHPRKYNWVLCKILSAHQSFFFFSNDNKLKYCLRGKLCYLFIHFDLLSLAIDGFVHLIFCKRVGRP